MEFICKPGKDAFAPRAKRTEAKILARFFYARDAAQAFKSQPGISVRPGFRKLHPGYATTLLK